MNLPDPEHYSNGVQFFRDSHKIILQVCVELERLLDDAETRGVFQSFAKDPAWSDVFQFMERAAPSHERQEQELVFPLVAEHVPHVGFQQPDSTIRFLIEGHEILIRKMIPLMKDWEVFLRIPQGDAAIETAHEKHPKEDAAFLANGRELIKLYREHIALEEERVYRVADKVLSGEEKFELAENIRDANSSEQLTGIYQFEEPRFSDPTYNVQYIPTEAISEDAIEPEEEEEEE
ncbi:MAG TPA: hemerythrin domain-containing protein [Candidatus Kapabacteria bacterium]|jgi:hemerythrin-like domain-containing protein